MSQPCALNSANDKGGSIAVRVIDCWTPEVIAEVANFASTRPEASPWEGRWTTTPDYYDWKCARNPVAPSVGALAYDGGRLIATSIVTFKTMTTRHGQITAGELGDLYVAPSHRGRGIFRRVVGAAVERAVAPDVKLIYCIPNANGYEALLATGHFIGAPRADHRTWLLPLRPMALLGTKISSVRWLAFADGPWSPAVRAVSRAFRSPTTMRLEEVPSLLRASPTPKGTRLPLSAGHFNYRVLGHPERDGYRALVADSPGMPIAAAIVKDTRYAGLPAVIVARTEAVDDAGWSRIIASATMDAISRSAAFIALWAPAKGPHARALRSRLFFPVQHKRIALASQTAGPEEQTMMDQLYLEMLDSDKA